MGLFGRKKKKIKNAAASASYSDFLLGLNAQRETNALKLSAVYSAISTISNTMSKIPFSVINRNTKEKIDDANIYNLLNVQPNEKMSASVMYQLVWSWAAIYGEAYILPVTDWRSAEVSARIPISPANVTKFYDERNNLFYRVTVGERNAQSITMRPDEIEKVVWKTFDGINGVSPLDYGRLTIQSGLNQEDFNKQFYENYGRPLGVLTTATNLSDRELLDYPIGTDSGGNVITQKMSMKEIVRYEWEKTHSGSSRFKTAVLDDGMKYETVAQITPEQMQFVNSKEVNVQDIARFFDMGSCMFKLGVGSQSYSTNEQGQLCYINETILPKLRQWEQELTLKLLTAEQRKKGWVVRGNINAELRGDSTTRASFYDKMRSMGVYNINEIRDLEDMPSIGELGETRLIGANSTPLERLVNGDSVGDVTPNPLSDKAVAQAALVILNKLYAQETPNPPLSEGGNE